jgi:hypothetical protein
LLLCSKADPTKCDGGLAWLWKGHEFSVLATRADELCSRIETGVEYKSGRLKYR